MAIKDAKKAHEEDPANEMKALMLGLHQYNMSISHRGDNTPENAAYLGYLDCRDLYPDFKTEPVEPWFKKVLTNNGEGALA